MKASPCSFGWQPSYSQDGEKPCAISTKLTLDTFDDTPKLASDAKAALIAGDNSSPTCSQHDGIGLGAAHSGSAFPCQEKKEKRISTPARVASKAGCPYAATSARSGPVDGNRSASWRMMVRMLVMTVAAGLAVRHTSLVPMCINTHVGVQTAE